MCPAVFVSSPSQFSAVSALVENSGKDTDVVVFTPEFISLLLINQQTGKHWSDINLLSTQLYWESFCRYITKMLIALEKVQMVSTYSSRGLCKQMPRRFRILLSFLWHWSCFSALLHYCIPIYKLKLWRDLFAFLCLVMPSMRSRSSGAQVRPSPGPSERWSRDNTTKLKPLGPPSIVAIMALLFLGRAGRFEKLNRKFKAKSPTPKFTPFQLAILVEVVWRWEVLSSYIG